MAHFCAASQKLIEKKSTNCINTAKTTTTTNSTHIETAMKNKIFVREVKSNKKKISVLNLNNQPEQIEEHTMHNNYKLTHRLSEKERQRECWHAVQQHR